jgi:hypothetical protein
MLILTDGQMSEARQWATITRDERSNIADESQCNIVGIIGGKFVSGFDYSGNRQNLLKRMSKYTEKQRFMILIDIT